MITSDSILLWIESAGTHLGDEPPNCTALLPSSAFQESQEEDRILAEGFTGAFTITPYQLSGHCEL
jgi:hypothetical protein